MEQTELRIGNLLNYPKYYRDGGDKIWSVRELSLDSPLIGLTDGKYQTKVAFRPLLPIPINEDHFIDARKQNFMFMCNSSRDEDGFFVWFNGNKIYIEFVHQLQNLYFALTLHELNLKSKQCQR